MENNTFLKLSKGTFGTLDAVQSANSGHIGFLSVFVQLDCKGFKQ